jgi:hypothetical protein
VLNYVCELRDSLLSIFNQPFKPSQDQNHRYLIECVKTRDDHRRRGYVTVIPLEANHSSCHYATKMRRAQIDGESINLVGLEEQHCNYRRFLVAFGVHLSQTRQIILFVIQH